MQIALSLEPVLPDGDPERVLRVAVQAERLGFDTILMSGHVLKVGGTALDPIVALAAVAGATERVQLMTGVLVLPYYEPIVLANQVASLDVLSGGRFTLGVGVGWNPAEFEALGVPISERGRRTDEHLTVMRTLWTDRTASFSGRFTSFSDATLGVEPLTPGGPPVWIGGTSDPALRRALRFGQAWFGTAAAPDAVADVRTRLAALGEAEGRDPATLELNSLYFLTPPGFDAPGLIMGEPLGGAVPSGESVIEDIGRLAEAGISQIGLYLPVRPEDFSRAIDWVAEEVLSRLHAAPVD